MSQKKATLKATAIDMFLTGAHFCYFSGTVVLSATRSSRWSSSAKGGEGISTIISSIRMKQPFEVYFLDNTALQS
jgi:hypothetical protein